MIIERDNMNVLYIRGKKTNFRFTQEEAEEFSELLSEIWTTTLVIPEKENKTFQGKRNNYDYSFKEIILDYTTVNVEDDDIDTLYTIKVCNKEMYILRENEWTPDDLEGIFFQLCYEAIHCSSKNFEIKYRQFEREEYLKFIKS